MQVAYYLKMKKDESPRRARRRVRLGELIAEVGSATQLANECGTPKSHVSAMLAGTRGLGDAMAEKLEMFYAKPPGWFDQPALTEGAPVAAPQAPVDINVNRRAPPDAVALLTGLCDLLASLEPGRAEIVSDMLGRLAKKPNDPALVQVIALLMAPEAFAPMQQNYG